MPEVRNRHHQKFCVKPDCQKASKAHSQRKWLSKSANRSYFRGSENVLRVQQWRKAHPGYWKKRPKKPSSTLQEVIPSKPVDNQPLPNKPLQEPAPLIPAPLQDILAHSPLVLLGLISDLTDSTLQENIVPTLQGYLQKGRDISGLQTRPFSPVNHENKETSSLPRAPAAHSGTV